MNPEDRGRADGFSLVEVTLALGIVVFGMVALVGLLAGGMQTGRDSMEDVHAANVAATIIAQRRATPLAANTNLILPPLTNATAYPATSGGLGTNALRQTLFLTQDGKLATDQASRYFRLDTRTASDADRTLAFVHLSLITPWEASPTETGTGRALRTRHEVFTTLRIPSP